MTVETGQQAAGAKQKSRRRQQQSAVTYTNSNRAFMLRVIWDTEERLQRREGRKRERDNWKTLKSVMLHMFRRCWMKGPWEDDNSPTSYLWISQYHIGSSFFLPSQATSLKLRVLFLLRFSKKGSIPIACSCYGLFETPRRDCEGRREGRKRERVNWKTLKSVMSHMFRHCWMEWRAFGITHQRLISDYHNLL